MLDIAGVAHLYPDGTRALDGVDLTIGPGLFGLLGPNGAGKSTLMRLIATLVRPSRGQIRFEGIDAAEDPRALRRQLGYLPQEFGVYPGMSAAALLDQLAVLKGVTGRAARRETVERLLVRVNLWDVRDRPVARFSGGMRRRFGVAQSLIGDPRLLVVDEPTAGLDPEERARFHELLADLGESAVVILSTHIVEDVANLCARVAVLAGGRILADGAPDALAARLDGRLWRAERARGAALPPGTIWTGLRGGRRAVRVVAEAAPAGDFAPAQPLLEDFYFATLKGAAC